MNARTKSNHRQPLSRGLFFARDDWFKLSLVVNVFFILSWMISTYRTTTAGDKTMMMRGDAQTWHGGHPIAKDHKGSCWCGAEDHYCMCTPNIAIDLILVAPDPSTTTDMDHHYVWLVRRKDTSQLATMGGFVDVSETVEAAVHRELKEEMGIVFDGKEEPLQLLGVYSDPRRDNRRRNVSVVFVVQLKHDVEPKAADDVKDVQKIALSQIEDHDFFSDHKIILLDYRHSLLHNKGGGNNNNKATLDDILAEHHKKDPALQAGLAYQRSVCAAI